MKKNIPLNIPVNTSINASIYNIQKREGFWISEYANTSTFTIQFNKTIQLAMIQFFPTYPNKTTDQFKLKKDKLEISPGQLLLMGQCQMFHLNQTLK